MRHLVRVAAVAVTWLLAAVPTAQAGMPSFKVNDLAQLRVESLSFFLVVFLLSTWLIQLIWNRLRFDFPRLPRLTYVKALGLVTLWGVLFVLVLTMISGARELLTPGAWDKVGHTYRLAEEKGTANASALPAQPPPPQLVEAVTARERRQKLDNLRADLRVLLPHARGPSAARRS